MTNFRFNELAEEAARRGCEIVLPLDSRGSNPTVRIEVRSAKKKSKILDYESVRRAENIDAAAERMLRRMRKDGLIN